MLSQYVINSYCSDNALRDNRSTSSGIESAVPAPYITSIIIHELLLNSLLSFVKIFLARMRQRKYSKCVMLYGSSVTSLFDICQIKQHNSDLYWYTLCMCFITQIVVIFVRGIKLRTNISSLLFKSPFLREYIGGLTKILR